MQYRTYLKREKKNLSCEIDKKKEKAFGRTHTCKLRMILRLRVLTSICIYLYLYIYYVYKTSDDTPAGKYFRANFLQSKGGTSNKNGGFGNLSGGILHWRIARRLHSPRFEKPSSENRPKGLVTSHVLFYDSSLMCFAAHRVGVVVVAPSVGARTHGNNPARLGHLIVNLLEGKKTSIPDQQPRDKTSMSTRDQRTQLLRGWLVAATVHAKFMSRIRIARVDPYR